MSAATLHPDLRSAVRARLSPLAGIPAAHAFEGVAFTPVEGTPWLRERMAAISSIRRGIGAKATIAHVAEARLTLFYPAGLGTRAIELAAGALLDAFEPGTSLVYGTARGLVIQAERSGLITEPSWLSCTVDVSITAYTAG